MRTLVWFRGKELRLADHAPLHDAIERGEAVPLFVLDPYFFAPERAQRIPHRIQFLLDSLRALSASIAARGSRLLVVRGKSHELIPRLAEAWRVDRVVAHRWTEPVGRERDARIARALGDRFELYEGETLLPPGSLRTQAGAPFPVFSQFARAFGREANLGKPLPAPRALPPIPHDLRAKGRDEIPDLAALGIARNERLLAGGEEAAHARLRSFVRARLRDYREARNSMDRDGTSRLSVDLKFGTLSARTVWHAADDASFRNELLWRELALHTLWDRPQLLREPFRAGFTNFPWRSDEAGWQAWTSGRTGYPIVDAAARQLLAEGFVHNRARMISASFLAKDLLIDFRRGEEHYLRFLTDGDSANNDLGWQWSAGCGCDAQPYFRVFNPVLQGERFDPSGAYVRAHVPELARLPSRYIHAPWLAPEQILAAAGVRLGKTYPRPIVEHALARERFLATAARHLKK